MLRMFTQVSIRCGHQVLDLADPRIMGIINMTPDSFYAPSRMLENPSILVDFAAKMIEDGAAILDIGGMSSRPGADEISVQEEMDRVIPAIEILKKHFPQTIISLDTYRATVAKSGIQAGATVINDISGGSLDPDMFKIVTSSPVAYILMHMRGTPVSMQLNTDYEDLIGELIKYFIAKIRTLQTLGMTDIILDPGFGFSKTMQQNYELIQKLEAFSLLGKPLLIGISRKSTLAKTIHRDSGDTLQATTALHMAALIHGARILRVHDVKAAADAIAVYLSLQHVQDVK